MSLYFLPYLRRGLATSMRAGSDPNASVSVGIRVQGESIEQSFSLYGPGDVVGLKRGQVARQHPPAGTRNFEANMFPYVEFSSPDLPWRYTPEVPGRNGRLKPWMVLVVVKKQQGVSLSSATEDQLPILQIQHPAALAGELPDLSDSWAWAHVQVEAEQTSTRELEALLDSQPDAFLSRLVSARRLEPSTAYWACLVPSYYGGVAAGLGIQADPSRGERDPAWKASDSQASLPVYYSWSFQTGERGDFESLVRKLQPRDLGEGIGMKPLDISKPGPGLPEKAGACVDFMGALASVSATPAAWPATHRNNFQRQLQRMLNPDTRKAAGVVPDYDALRDDPVVAPPVYGSMQSGRNDVDARKSEKYWLDGLNLHPAHRSAAGLGAKAVRQNQETLMASAWTQAEAVREARRELQQAKLATGVSVRIKEHIDKLDHGSLVQLMQPFHHRVQVSRGKSIQALLKSSVVPDGMISPSFRRTLSRSAAMRRCLKTGGAKTSDRLIAAFKPRAAISGFAAKTPPKGMQADMLGMDISELNSALGSNQRASSSGPKAKAGAPSGVAFGTANAANQLRRQIKPAVSIAGQFHQRVVLPEGLHKDNRTLPASLDAQPVFPDPASIMLQAISTEYVLPGIGQVGDNEVGLLKSNPEFVEAFLAGMNHEMGKEFLWREYPASLRGTWFRQFWDRLGDPSEDIPPIAGWTKGLGDNANSIGDGGALVLLMRGEVIKRYPGMAIYSIASMPGQSGPDWRKAKLWPRFGGRLDEQTVFLGFDLSADKAMGGGRNPGCFFVFEENVTQLRFGLDAVSSEGEQVDYSQSPKSVDDLSWGHVLARDADVAYATLASLRGAKFNRNSLTWGGSPEDMACITLQKPVRMAVHARVMLTHGGSGEQ